MFDLIEYTPLLIPGRVDLGLQQGQEVAYCPRLGHRDPPLRVKTAVQAAQGKGSAVEEGSTIMKDGTGYGVHQARWGIHVAVLL